MDERSNALAVLPDAVQHLAAHSRGEVFLEPHHLEAARRLTRLYERALLRQRVTMSYDPGRVGGNGGRPVQGDLADSAAGARQRLAGLARQLPADCWGVLSDVCGFDKGLQQIETERGWPRRSAKLVLRIGLDQLAGMDGLVAEAQGRQQGPMRAWLPDRLPMFADNPAG